MASFVYSFRKLLGIDLLYRGGTSYYGARGNIETHSMLSIDQIFSKNGMINHSDMQIEKAMHISNVIEKH